MPKRPDWRDDWGAIADSILGVTNDALACLLIAGFCILGLLTIISMLVMYGTHPA
jgi:hypothetical protein